MNITWPQVRLLILIGLCFAIGFALGSWQEGQYGDSLAGDEKWYDPDDVAAWAAVAAVLVAFVGIVVAGMQFKALKKANKTAEKAAKAAKASVEAFIESERGYVLHHDSRAPDLNWMIDYAFHNVGRSAITINYFWSHPTSLPKRAKGISITPQDVPPPHDFTTTDHAFTKLKLPPGAYLSTFQIRGKDVILTSESKLPLPVYIQEQLNAGTHDVIVHYMIGFETLLGRTYESRFTFRLVVDTRPVPMEAKYQTFTSDALTYDKRVK